MTPGAINPCAADAAWALLCAAGMRHVAFALAVLAAGVPAAHAITVERANVTVTLHDAGPIDAFRVKATLDALPDVDLTQVPVRLRFGDAEQELPAGSFRRRKGGFAWKVNSNGIHTVVVKPRKGLLDVRGSGYELGDLPSPVIVALAIGDEEGCAEVRWLAERRMGSARRAKRRKIADGRPGGCASRRSIAGIPPTLQITSPTFFDGISGASPTITLGGLAFDDQGVTGMSWSNDRGGGASVLPETAWTIADIPLQPGDNVLRVTATDADGNVSEDVLVATYNLNGIVFDGVPVATPDGLFVGEAVEVRIRQAIAVNPDLDPASVRLSRVTATTAPSPVGVMTDDGDLAKGDEIQSDGVYTGVVGLGSFKPGLHRYRVSARTRSNPQLVAWSPVLTFPFVEHVTEAQLAGAIALANDAQALLTTKRAGGASTGDALEAVVAMAKERGAQLAEVGESGEAAWWLDASGLLGGVLAHDDATERGGAPMPAPGTSRVAAPLVGDGAELASRRVAIVAPYFADEEPAAVADLFTTQQCPPFPLDVWTGADAGAERFENLDRYGVVLVASHGETLFHSIAEAYREEWRWGSVGAQVITLTGTTLSESNRERWERDLRLGSMAILPGGVAAILPSFITRHNVRFPQSVVHLGACGSALNTTMASAFFGRGAATFYGYDGHAASSFVRDRAVDLMTKLLAGDTTGAAFTPGLTDGGTPPASFTMLGRSDLSILGDTIVNASFEADSGLAANVPGWIVEGDGRVLGGLGSTLPTDGVRMGLISTGLGFTESTGSITQPICLPALPLGKTTMRLVWDWNFFSEEFLEYCGDVYQDSFSVSFGMNELFSVRIDDLCDAVTPVDVGFDKGGVYATGWREASVDVTAFAGTSGDLVFAAHDVGDGIYDSAILLDRVRIVVE
jgi:hypothetical protein